MAKTEIKRQPCEIYTRCVGYIRTVSQFNAGKRAEYEERITFKINDE
jgi:ribonucleoside-triphosphate reductase